MAKIVGPFWVDTSPDYERAFVVGKDGRIMCSVLGDLQTMEEKLEHARRIAAALNRDEAVGAAGVRLAEGMAKVVEETRLGGKRCPCPICVGRRTAKAKRKPARKGRP